MDNTETKILTKEDLLTQASKAPNVLDDMKARPELYVNIGHEPTGLDLPVAKVVVAKAIELYKTNADFRNILGEQNRQAGQLIHGLLAGEYSGESLQYARGFIAGLLALSMTLNSSIATERINKNYEALRDAAIIDGAFDADDLAEYLSSQEKGEDDNEDN